LQTKFRQTLSSGRAAAERSAAVATASLIGLLPRRVRSHLRELTGFVGRLDYKKADIWLSIDSDIELKTRLRSCYKEPETVQWIEEFLRPGDVFYDIGANVGAYSLVADAATSGKCRIFAFEPSFANYAQLTRNIFLNKCQGRVVPLQIALSDTTGLVPFHYSSLVPGTAFHTVQETNGGGAATTDHLAISYQLKDLVRELQMPQPNHIKLDVDGVELAVLRGADTVLDNSSLRSVLVEIDGPDQPIVSYLKQHGFEVRSRHVHGEEPGAPANYIFTRT
jgi:FkbM family methyltransferase